MRTVDRASIAAAIDLAFHAAADVERWPEFLPHYRWVRMRERERVAVRGSGRSRLFRARAGQHRSSQPRATKPPGSNTARWFTGRWSSTNSAHPTARAWR